MDKPKLEPLGIVDGRTPEELRADGDSRWPDGTPYVPRPFAEWSPEAKAALIASVRRSGELREFSNRELSEALMLIWVDGPVNTWQKDAINEAIGRLAVWDRPIAEIRPEIEAEADRIGDEPNDHTAMLDAIRERVKARLGIG